MEAFYRSRYQFLRFVTWYKHSRFDTAGYGVLGILLGYYHGCFNFWKRVAAGEYADCTVVTEYTVPTDPGSGLELSESKVEFESKWNSLARKAQKFIGYENTMLFKPLYWNWRDVDQRDDHSVPEIPYLEETRGELQSYVDIIKYVRPILKENMLGGDLLLNRILYGAAPEPHRAKVSLSVAGMIEESPLVSKHSQCAADDRQYENYPKIINDRIERAKSSYSSEDSSNSSSTNSDHVHSIERAKCPTHNYLEVRLWRNVDDYRGYLLASKESFEQSISSNPRVCDRRVGVVSTLYSTVVDDSNDRIIR